MDEKQGNKTARNDDLESSDFGINMLRVTMDHKLNMNMQNSKENKTAISGCAKENTTDSSVVLLYHEDCLLPKLFATPGWHKSSG